MPHRFCTHLQDYGTLYQQAGDAYHACNEALDSVLEEGPRRETVDRLAAALEAWLELDRLLREALVDLVREGRVRVPRKRTRVKKRKNAPICAECGFRIPRLAMPEWRIAGNGEVAYRGRELPFAADPLEEAAEPVPSGAEEVGS